MTTKKGSIILQTEQKRRNYFTFFRSFQEAIDQYDEKDQLPLYRGIVNYALDGKEPVFDNPLLRLAWILIRPTLRKGWINYLNGCEGGAPTGNQNARKTTKKQPKNNRKTTKKQRDRKGMDRNRNGEIDLFPPLSPKGETVYDWSLLSDDMRIVAEEWLKYKREKKQTYKPSGFKTFCKRLIQLSGNNPSKARLIIEQSMANNYSGIFELKNRTNEATSANIHNNKERHVADGDVHEQSLRIIGRLSAEGGDSEDDSF